MSSEMLPIAMEHKSINEEEDQALLLTKFHFQDERYSSAENIDAAASKVTLIPNVIRKFLSTSRKNLST